MWLDRDRLTGGYSSRSAGIDATHVVDLAEFDGKWPPILGYRRDGKGMDGHHRAQELSASTPLVGALLR